MNSIFAKMNDEEIGKVLAISETVNYKAGEIIFEQDSDPDRIIIIKKGEVSLVKVSDIGNDIELTTVSAGSFLGEISLLDGREREITAISLSEVEAFSISKKKLDMMEHFDNAALTKFYIALIRGVNKRLRKINEEYGKIKEKLSKSL